MKCGERERERRSSERTVKKGKEKRLSFFASSMEMRDQFSITHLLLRRLARSLNPPRRRLMRNILTHPRERREQRTKPQGFARRIILFSWNDQSLSLSFLSTHQLPLRRPQPTTLHTRRSAPGRQSRALPGSGPAGRRSGVGGGRTGRGPGQRAPTPHRRARPRPEAGRGGRCSCWGRQRWSEERKMTV